MTIGTFYRHSANAVSPVPARLETAARIAIDEQGAVRYEGVWVLCALTTQVQVPNVQFPCRRGAGLLVTSSSGTSWSAGTTSGLAALLVAQIGKGNPAQIRAWILQTADDFGEPGTDARYGRGRINVGRAVGAVP